MDNSTEQPTKFAAYPRGQKSYGSAEHLQAIADAYYGLNRVGLVAFMFGLAVPTVGDAIGHLSVALLVSCVILASMATGAAAYSPLRKLGTVCHWRQQTPIFLSILVGLVTPYCFGFFILALAQSQAARELRKYGLGNHFLGITRQGVAQKIQQMKASTDLGSLPDYGFSPPSL